ncbi:hypothetical protein BGZ72_000163 [Mortierella alpina]|nr:hypothetical protein BGZ72_000163 [Mortierella alpina]
MYVPEPFYILAQSNPAPSGGDPGDLTWSLVSAVNSAGLNTHWKSINPWDVVCAVDETGVFSILAYPQDLNATIIAGLQFQPASVTGGNGIWKDISASLDVYYWDPFVPSKLFYFKDGLGKNTLMHAYVMHGSPVGIDVKMNVAALDPLTGVMNPSLARWTSGLPLKGLFMSTTVAGGKIYTIGYTYTGSGLTGAYQMITVPITSPSINPPAPSAFTIANITGMESCKDSIGSRPRSWEYNESIVVTCQPM